MSRAIREVLRDLARLYELLQLHDGLTAAELAARLSIDRKRVYDQVEYLRAFLGEGAVVKRGARFALALDAPRALSVLRPDRRVLAIASRLLAAVGMPHEAEFEKLFVRLMGGRTADARSERASLAAEVERHLHFAEPVLYRSPGDVELITRLYDLCTTRPRPAVRFAYRTATNPVQAIRRVTPLGLVFNHAWYLVAHDATRAEPVRTYALDRLADLRVEHLRTAVAPLDFDLAARMRPAWRLIVGDGEPRAVVLRMTPALAAARKHPSQEIVQVGEAWTDVRFWVSDPLEMVGFVLSHIDAIEVVEPTALRDAVVERLRAGCTRYALRDGGERD